MKLSLKVVPGASRNSIAGWLGESLKVRVTAPAENGKANVAVIALLAKTLKIPKTSIQVQTGKTNARKIIEIGSLSKDQAYQKLVAAGHQKVDKTRG